MNRNDARIGTAVWWLVPCVILLVYWPCLSGELVHDDELNFPRNAALREGDVWLLVTQPFFREHLFYWRPLASLVMALGYCAGLFSVHLASLLLHVLVTYLAFRIARRVLGDARAALGAAVLFAVHPVQVESVAWASAVAGPLSSLFVLLAVDALQRWSPERGQWWCWRVAVWVLLALLSKENAVAAVPLLAALACGSEGTRPRSRWLVLCGWLVVVTAAWLALRALVMGRVLAPAVPAPLAPGPLAFVAGALEVLLRQVGLLVVPWPLTTFRPLQHAAVADGAAGLVAVLGVLVAVVLLCAWVWWRLAARWRLALALCIVPLLLPALTHRSLGEFPLVDRYLYLSVLGFTIAVAGVAGRHVVVLALAAAAGGVVSFNQCAVWHDESTFVANGLAHAPHNATVHVVAGNLHLSMRRSPDPDPFAQARREYAEAIRLTDQRTDFVGVQRRAAALIGLAWCDLLDPRVVDEAALNRAVECFRTALADNEAAVSGWVGLGVAHALSRQFEPAREAFVRALAIDPQSPQAWFNLGRMQVDTGQVDGARRSLEQALRCDPRLDAAAQLLAEIR